MLGLIISWVGTCLGIGVLLRGVQTRLLPKYPYFYAYSASALFVDLPIALFYTMIPRLYFQWYWPSNFVTLALGYGILLEIFKHVLSPYAGAERFARNLALAVFAFISCVAILASLLAPASVKAGTYMEIERDFRAVQAIFILAVLAVIAYYQIPVGINMKGMIAGYGLYVGTSLMSLALRSYLGAWFDTAWETIQPLSYDVSRFIWLVTLWSYHPNPAPEPRIRLEEDYGALALRTRALINTMRARLCKAVRS